MPKLQGLTFDRMDLHSRMINALAVCAQKLYITFF